MQSPDIKKAEVSKDYTLILTFINGETKLFDMKPYLKYPVFKSLNGYEEFKNFSIVDGTIEWKCGAELSTDTFYIDSKNINKETLKEM
ncbi:DUF2442 domain-containing protein [Clostridium sp. DJ247]|uniref:DUF2442 domain-containing protein n=1 Tax=Clostridium sp. DJ247 TaxID=2726188 RepID=UPI0016242E08|nr:DUF2442 domain-containing protein [Clostridium sp. DJ247]MBC2579181.1 DUF2442 domain-containing protein [Clostridium sp. DJ247]